MKTCDHCGAEMYMDFTCKRCGGTFCTKCRIAEMHACPNKNMSQEDIAIRAYLDMNGPPRRYAPEETPPIATRDGQGDEQRRGRLFGSDIFGDEEEDGARPGPRDVKPVVNMNAVLTLLPLIVFLGIDVLYFVLLPNPLFAIPLGIHAVFLPWLLYEIRKIKRTENPTPEMLLQYMWVTAFYMLVYFGLKLTISVLIGDFISVMIFSFFGIRAVFNFLQIRAYTRALEET